MVFIIILTLLVIKKDNFYLFYFIGLFYFTNEAIAITPVTDFIAIYVIAFSKQTTDQMMIPYIPLNYFFFLSHKHLTMCNCAKLNSELCWENNN